MIIDTKWKRIGRHPEDARHGISQADVYQMMAYARFINAHKLCFSIHIMQVWQPLNAGYRILAGKEQLQVASVNLVLDEDKIVEQLINLLSINTQ
jgi:5-methylcytosine-specific restriction enzyme subunit McrC